jgi:hypothetical protein
MPQMSGFEVCEFIKKNEKLKHIPVVLLVGSFEPFDEAEARRVGADEILTKPFQSIRRLIERVGGLMTGQQGDEGPTAELPTSVADEQPEQLTTAELEITTADTQPLPEELVSFAAPFAKRATEQVAREETMETSLTNSRLADRALPESTDELLDLGDFAARGNVSNEEFILDLDSPEPETAAAGAARSARIFVEPQISIADAYRRASLNEAGNSGRLPAVSEAFAETQELTSPFEQRWNEPQLERITDGPEDLARSVVVAESAGPSVSTTLKSEELPEQLSPEAIDAIARRVVALMSEKAVQEIAWEVVPQLAELMIKRQLEEKKH